MEVTDPSADQSSTWYVTNGLLVQELITGQLQTGDNQFATRSPALMNVAGDADDQSGPTYATMAQVRHAAPPREGTILTQRIGRDGSVWANIKVGNVYQDVLLQCFERRCLTYTPDNPTGWQVEAGNVGQHYYQWRYGNTSPPTSPQPPPTVPETPPSTQLPEPIYTDAWLNPEASVSNAFGGDPEFVNYATEIAGLYNLTTADLGIWNHDTTGFVPWLQAYADFWYTTDGSSDRQQLFEHAYVQTLIGINGPESNLGLRIQHFEQQLQQDNPGAGPLVYWGVLVGPAWESARMEMTPFARAGVYNQFWSSLVPDCGYVRTVDPSIETFADYLSSRNYGQDGLFSVQ